MHIRRLFRAILELREIVLAAYRGRNEVLRAALSPWGYEALANGLEDRSTSPNANDLPSKEASLRSFLENSWVTGFHDVDVDGDLIIPEQIANGQVYDGREASKRGRQAIQELASESTAIIKDYSHLLNSPFTLYCETQRKWAETDAVRDREYEGDVLVKKLSSKHRTDIVELNKSMTSKHALALQRLASVIQVASDPWIRLRHWQFNSYTDLLYRRIVFHSNYNFDNHASASYELTLGKEREAYQQEEEARKQREEDARKEREMAEALLRAAIVPFSDADDEDDVENDVDEEEDGDLDRSDSEGFLGWDVQGGKDDSLDQSACNGDDEERNGEIDTSLDHKSNNESKDTIDESEWDQIDAADLDETTSELDPFSWARKFMWAEGERFVHSFESVVIVSIRSTMSGTILLTSHSIYFHQIGDTIDVMTKEVMESTDGKKNPPKQDRKWKLNRLTDVHGRRYMLKAQALELFFANMEGMMSYV